ncbi:MAG: hypothetical protein E2O54_15395 [Gammaproteobacteria bacterium]|nr:MAG: hypothetical protein E2O54_15395 [Gammaproteobacteria bacterium]
MVPEKRSGKERFKEKWCTAKKPLTGRHPDSNFALRYCTAPIQYLKGDRSMSAIERGQTFVKELNELNTSGVSEFFNIQREALEGLVEANRERFAALREIKGLNDFVSVERDFYAAVQKGFTSTVEKQSELARGNWDTTGNLVRSLFATSDAANTEAATEEAVANVA